MQPSFLRETAMRDELSTVRAEESKHEHRLDASARSS